MKDVARVLGTVVVWGAVVGLTWLFHLFGHLDGFGEACMVIVGLCCTAGIWKFEL